MILTTSKSLKRAILRRIDDGFKWTCTAKLSCSCDPSVRDLFDKEDIVSTMREALCTKFQLHFDRLSYLVQILVAVKSSLTLAKIRLI